MAANVHQTQFRLHTGENVGVGLSVSRSAKTPRTISDERYRGLFLVPALPQLVEDAPSASAGFWRRVWNRCRAFLVSDRS